MDQNDLFRRLALALAIVLLIGLERGWRLREEAEAKRPPGLSTHALTGLRGGIRAALSAASQPAVLAAVLAADSVSFTAAAALFACDGSVAGTSWRPRRSPPPLSSPSA